MTDASTQTGCDVTDEDERCDSIKGGSERLMTTLLSSCLCVSPASTHTIGDILDCAFVYGSSTDVSNDSTDGE